MSNLEKDCLSSWQRLLPDYEIKLWNEDSLNLAHYSFASKAYTLKKYAFVSDVVRLHALYYEGGVYLDTDMLLLRSLDPFLNYKVFLGYDSDNSLNASIIGAEKNNPYIKKMLREYDSFSFDLAKKKTIPLVISSIQVDSNVTCFKKEYFYPLPFEKKTEDYRNFITKNTVAVHLWNHSWKDKYSYLQEGEFTKALYLAITEFKLVLSSKISIKDYFIFFRKWFIKMVSRW